MERREDISGKEFLEMAMRGRDEGLAQCPILRFVPVPDGSMFH